VGIWAPSLVGAVSGAVAAAAVTVTRQGLGVGFSEIVLMLVGVFTLNCGAEALRSSLGRPRRLLLVGVSEAAQELVQDLADNESLPFEWVGVVAEDEAAGQGLRIPLLGTVSDLPRIVPRTRPDLVVVADLEQRDRAIDHLVGMANLGFRIVGVPEIYEYALGRVPVRHLREPGS
jgi:FlaA1/EpsC-like NDP-sugar epimerase